MAPSREALLRTRVTTLAAYATAVHSELKMSKAQSLALYGSAIVPVPVPLRANETLQQNETRFRAWLFRERNRTVEAIGADANVERSCRFAFARAEGRAFWATGGVQGEHEDNVEDKDLVKMEPRMERTVVVVGIKREREEDADDEKEKDQQAAHRYQKMQAGGEGESGDSPDGRAANALDGGSPAEPAVATEMTNERDKIDWSTLGDGRTY